MYEISFNPLYGHTQRFTCDNNKLKINVIIINRWFLICIYG